MTRNILIFVIQQTIRVKEDVSMKTFLAKILHHNKNFQGHEINEISEPQHLIIRRE